MSIDKNAYNYSHGRQDVVRRYVTKELRKGDLSIEMSIDKKSNNYKYGLSCNNYNHGRQDVVRRYVTKELRKLGGDLNPAIFLGPAGNNNTIITIVIQ